jgi:hypothetical protein
MAAKKRARKVADEGSAVERPDYGEKGHPQPIAPNKTDAEGVDSNWSAPAGVDPTRATPHTTPEVTDPSYAERRRLEAKAHGEEIPKSERPPQVLIGALDVKRGDGIYRIPAHTVVEDAELSDEEWNLVVKNDLCREAKISEYQESQRRKAAEDVDAKLLELKKKQLGVRPKKASDSAPRGAALVANLAEGAAEVQRTLARRAVAQAEASAARVERAAMRSGGPVTKRAAKKAAAG